jgi:hypothetical protein
MMFRHLILLALASLLMQPKASADGLPYSSGTSGHRFIRCEYISLRLSDAQVDEVARTGVVSFTQVQLKKLRLVYPEFPTKAGVFSSTHNDGVEPEGPEAYVIWWHADEVVVTLEEAEPNQKVFMPSDQPATPIEDTLFRLAPDGRIYHQTKSVSLKEAFQLIDELSVVAAKEKDAATQSIVIPPPSRRDVDLHESSIASFPSGIAEGDTYATVLRIAKSLQTYAQAKGIQLFTTW